VTPLVEMMRDARKRHRLSQKDFAAVLDFTPQYVCDLEKGRRLGSVEFVNRLCDWLGADDRGRKQWHLAGARSHGWNV
jgi:transcriptional regulator with XRE-family HTH domain